ncbi:YegP family protein [Tenacibaculum sp. 1B UA]|uniref:YegP family protein n=1 Tax=unclassified Tenacibaculum TaxID=2635139 RepID=UPI0026E11EB9|nr:MULTISPECIES: YegP family protein [unclassified Tenacibaculum]MDO6676474.1 YegP family protein [Tenacibaculum sp. 1_MG-2023]MDX8554200.1 YegP family protein [Tenacibaculum sp. 1B UA]
MGNPKFEITKTTNDEFMFNLKAGNGEVILTSQCYDKKQGCENGITSVKENAPDSDNFEKKKAIDDSFYFTLKAQNGEVIGKSEMYTTTSARDKGIESVKKNAPIASVEEKL